MTAPTHATLATFRMDLQRETEQREGLHALIVPGVSAVPGFVHGTWTIDRETSESLVWLTFTTLADAEAMAESVRANAEHQRAVGLDLVSIRVLEVAAAAPVP